MPGSTTLAPTYALMLAEDATGALTMAETDIGTTHKAACRDLAGGHVPHGFVLRSVIRLDPVSGLMTDVTRWALHEVVAICERERWEPSPRLTDAFARYRVAPPSTVIPIDTPDPDYAADIARAETALITQAHDRGDALLKQSEAA